MGNATNLVVISNFKNIPMNNKYSIYILIIVTLITGITLYNISGKTHFTSKKIHSLEKQIKKENHNIAVLKAEFSALTAPDRIEKLTSLYIPKLQPPKAEQIVSNISELDKKLNALTSKSTKTKTKTKYKSKIRTRKNVSKKIASKIKIKNNNLIPSKLNSIEDLINRTLAQDENHIGKTNKLSNNDK